VPLGAIGVVEHEIRIDASPQTVFEFFIDPEKMTRWKGIGARLDARPGGEYHVDVTHNDVAVGRYVEVDAPRRIVFTWGWEGDEHVPPGSTTVEVTLTPDGDGTLVRLIHRDLPAPAAGEHLEGWKHYLGRLAVAASGGDAGPDPEVGHEMGHERWGGEDRV
jgi:uncharacterized protein YndB with AHSA1/START domain